MTPDLTALEEAAKKATPGPWSHEATTFSKIDRILYSNRSGTMHGLNLMTLADGDWNHVNNVEFISIANPSTILSLISTIRSLERERDEAFKAGMLRAAEIADRWATEEQRQFGGGGPAAAIRAEAERGRK